MRKRYRWDIEKQGLVEMADDWTGAERRSQTPTEELIYGGAVATDGTPINSRKKHREYKARHGLADADDFKGQWARQAEQRERAKQGDIDHKARREALGRAFYERFKP